MMRHLYADGGLAGKTSPPYRHACMLTPRKQESQNRAAADLAATVAREVFDRHRPADRAVANYFRDHRYLGSRDRRQLSETVFAMFRWWGWLNPSTPLTLPSPPRGESVAVLSPLPSGGEDQGEGADWRALLEAAAVFEQSPPANADWTKLLPAWTLAEIRCPVDKLIPWLQRRPPLWLRTQRTTPAAVVEALQAAGLAAVPHERLPAALRVNQQIGNLFLLPVYEAGHVEIQDLASQAIGAVCAPRPGDHWWDACAGGGGKTLLLAETAGKVLATDIREKALIEMRRRAKRAGFTNIASQTWDGETGAPGTFDGVLVDAPCTGSGTWRRNPAARWSLTPEDLDAATHRQAKLLRAAAAGVKPGGVLVYATCSLFDRENRQIVEEFLCERPEFRLEPVTHPLTGAPTDGLVEIWPWDGDCDAMFAARMRRQ
jgi:16S rRNA (cytosine967-C5)-methyltransferase